MVGRSQVIEPLLTETDFEIFGTTRPRGQNNLDQSWITAGGGTQGQLESNPHNRVHCTVGGLMCNAKSPSDPIFMLHHGNIDRIWAVWNSLGRTNTPDPLWRNMEFQNHFFNAQGTQYTVKVSDLENPENLGYSYGLEPSPMIELHHLETTERWNLFVRNEEFAPVGGRAPHVVKVLNNKEANKLQPLDLALNVGADELIARAGKSRRIKFGERTLTTDAVSTQRAPRVFAILRDFTPPKGHDTEVRVFINCDYLSQEVPTTDPHYVTTIGFFGAHTHGDGKKKHPSIIADITPALRRLSRKQSLDTDTVRVQLLPVPRPGSTLDEVNNLKPTSVELLVV